MDELSFRPYQQADLPLCGSLAADAWPAVSRLVPAADSIRFMEAYAEIDRVASSWHEVACLAGEVSGFLFGRINADYSWQHALGAAPASLKLALKIITGKYGRLAQPHVFLRKFIATTMKIEQRSPDTEASVELFVVDSQVRGKGIGRALLDRFVAAARGKGTTVVTLYTDPMSNWGFYEKYGFRRYSEFDDDLNSYITGQPMKGFIYVMHLDQAQPVAKIS